MTRLIVKQAPPAPAGQPRSIAANSLRADNRGARAGQDMASSASMGESAAMVASRFVAAPRAQHEPFSHPADSHGAGYDNSPQAKSRAGSNRQNEWEEEAGAAWGNNCDNFDDSQTAEYNSADEHEYNSGDEAGGGQNKEAEGVDLDEVELEMILRKAKGFRIKKMGEDGNCMFRAVSDQIYGDPGMHDDVRALCVDYLRAERDHFSQFVTEDFDQYLARKRQDKVYGNNVELQAMSELFNRPIEVYRSSADPMKIFHEAYDADSATPMRLSYHRGNHYNSVINPDVNTVGEGLGLPGYEAEPRRIEDEFEKTVLRESEQAEMEAKLLELALKDSQEQWERGQVDQQLEQLSIQESRALYWGGVTAGIAESQWMMDGGSAAGARCERR